MGSLFWVFCFVLFFSVKQILIELPGDLAINSFSKRCSVGDFWGKTGKISISCKDGSS